MIGVKRIKEYCDTKVNMMICWLNLAYDMKTDVEFQLVSVFKIIDVNSNLRFKSLQSIYISIIDKTVKFNIFHIFIATTRLRISEKLKYNVGQNIYENLSESFRK